MSGNNLDINETTESEETETSQQNKIPSKRVVKSARTRTKAADGA